MEMWLKTSGKSFRFPVLPPSFFINDTAIINKPDILNKGNISIFGGNGLKTVTISSFFPAENYSFCNYSNFPSPYECVKAIEDWIVKGQDIRFIVTDTDINMHIMIESFEYGERAGSRDIEFTLTMVEFKQLTIGTNTSTSSSTGGVRPTPDPPKQQRTHKVVKGDSLWSIAQRYYGNGSKYPTIKSANQSKYPSLKSNNLIYSGWELVIP